MKIALALLVAGSLALLLSGALIGVISSTAQSSTKPIPAGLVIVAFFMVIGSLAILFLGAGSMFRAGTGNAGLVSDLPPGRYQVVHLEENAPLDTPHLLVRGSGAQFHLVAIDEKPEFQLRAGTLVRITGSGKLTEAS